MLNTYYAVIFMKFSLHVLKTCGFGAQLEADAHFLLSKILGQRGKWVVFPVHFNQESISN